VRPPPTATAAQASRALDGRVQQPAEADEPSSWHPPAIQASATPCQKGAIRWARKVEAADARLTGTRQVCGPPIGGASSSDNSGFNALPRSMYVIDATHYLNHKGQIAIERGPARKMADFVTSVIAHASDFDRAEGNAGPACFKCRKRDDRRVVTGFIDDATIVWRNAFAACGLQAFTHQAVAQGGAGLEDRDHHQAHEPRTAAIAPARPDRATAPHASQSTH
jgi:hypothetical protein